MDKNYTLEELGLSAEGETVTLLVNDVDLTWTSEHSGGIESKGIELDSYQCNARGMPFAKRFFQTIHAAPSVLCGFATMGINQARVEALAQTYGITQQPLLIELGNELVQEGVSYIVKESTGKNRHIASMIRRYNEILKPFGKHITHVILLDDSEFNLDMLRKGDDKYIQIQSDGSNNFATTFDCVKVTQPMLELVSREKQADGSFFTEYRREYCPQLDCMVNFEFPYSKNCFKSSLSQVLDMLGLHQSLTASLEQLFFPPPPKHVHSGSSSSEEVIYGPDSENEPAFDISVSSSHEESLTPVLGHLQAFGRSALTTSCGSEAEESGDMEEGFNQDGRAVLLSSH